MQNKKKITKNGKNKAKYLPIYQKKEIKKEEKENSCLVLPFSEPLPSLAPCFLLRPSPLHTPPPPFLII